MKQIVRTIFNKSGCVLSGRKAQLSKYWYLFMFLVLFGVFFFGSSVFSAGEPSGDSKTVGKFVDNPNMSGGWEYVKGNKVYTPYSVTEDLGDGRKFATIFSAPEYVKEDNLLKNKKEARSLKGYYEPRNLQDDGIHAFEYLDWNWTSVTLKPYVKDAKELNKLILLKVNGIVNRDVVVSSMDKDLISGVVLSFDNVVGSNWTLGQYSTTDTIVAVDNNGSFADTTIRGQSPYTDKNDGASGDIEFMRRVTAPDTHLGLVLFNLADIIGVGNTIQNLTFNLYVSEAVGTPDIYLTEVTTYWDEGNIVNYANAGNASWDYPNDSSDEIWTTGANNQFADLRNNYLGLNLSSLLAVPNQARFVSLEFITANAQTLYDSNGNISFVMNVSYAGSNAYINSDSLEGTNPWKFYVEYTSNIAPSNPIVVESPLDSFSNVPVYCVGSVNDSEGGILTVDVEVFKGNVSQFLLVNNSAFNNVHYNFTIDSANFSVGDEWGCGMRVYDQTDYSDWVNASQFTVIQNTAPYIDPLSNVTLTPSPEANDDFDLSCTFTPLDDQNTSLIAYVEWYNHSVRDEANDMSMPVTNNTQASFILEDANTTIGDAWKCGVRIWDGNLYSDWSNSSETEIVSVANKTDFTDAVLQSNYTKAVYVYDASKETWDRSDTSKDWYTEVGSFPDKVYLFLTDEGLDVMYTNGSRWMDFIGNSNHAIEAIKDFTSVYALDGRVYVGSDEGLYVLDFVNDEIYKYNSSGIASYNDAAPFENRNADKGYTFSAPTANLNTLRSNVVNDVYASRVRGAHLVAVATDGVNTGELEGAVTIFNMDNGDIAELDFCNNTGADYDSDSVVIADDGTLYFSESNELREGGETKLSYKYNIDTYNATNGRGEGYAAGAKGDKCANVGYRSISNTKRAISYPHFLSEKINDIHIASGESRRHAGHNMIHIATEEGVTVIQEVQDNEGRGISKAYGYTGSTNSYINYKVLEGTTDNITAISARSDGNAMYVGTYNGASGGSVSKISLNSNTLVDSWNTTTDIAIVGNDITGLDFLDGDLLIGTLSNGATQIVEQELDHYLVADYTNHRVVEIDNTGLIHWSFGVYGAASNDTTHLTYPTNAVRHDDGNYLIADSGNRRILEVDPDGTVVQQISNLTQLSDATYFGEVYSVQKIS